MPFLLKGIEWKGTGGIKIKKKGSVIIYLKVFPGGAAQTCMTETIAITLIIVIKRLSPPVARSHKSK